jgi:hypothetical protein
MKGAEQSFFAAGVMAHQITSLKAGMGEVAAATARDFDFLQDLFASFEDDHLGLGQEFGAANGPKKASGTATDNDNSGLSLWAGHR